MSEAFAPCGRLGCVKPNGHDDHCYRPMEGTRDQLRSKKAALYRIEKRCPWLANQLGGADNLYRLARDIILREP